MFRRLKRFDKIFKFTSNDGLKKIEKVANASKDSISEVLVELREDMETLLSNIHSKMEAYYIDDVDSEDLYSNESEEECCKSENEETKDEESVSDEQLTVKDDDTNCSSSSESSTSDC